MTPIYFGFLIQHTPIFLNKCNLKEHLFHNHNYKIYLSGYTAYIIIQYFIHVFRTQLYILKYIKYKSFDCMINVFYPNLTQYNNYVKG